MKFKFITTSKLRGKYNLKYDFAIYKDVSLLCGKNSYYFDEFNFDKQSKSFKILTVPIIEDKHLLFPLQ